MSRIPLINARDLPSRGRQRQLPPGAVWIDRRSEWGNPFRIGQVDPRPSWWLAPIAMDRDAVVAAYRAYMLMKLFADPHWLDPLRSATALVCWCAPEPCHGDVIAEYLEQQEESHGRPSTPAD
jgi:hypothetical protein